MGRKNLFSKLKATINRDDHPIWIHCASLGEFEQGRPLIEKIKKENPNEKILLTFFSPSGYEIRKDYEFADYVFYLPLDTRTNALAFLEIIQPKLVIFVKYEFWLNFLNIIADQKIPLYLISATFRPNQIFFKPYGKQFLKVLSRFSHIFVQNGNSKDLLSRNKITQVTVAGDTRIDRVYQISQHVKPIPKIAKFCQNKKIFIAGSSWEKDEIIIARFIKEEDIEDWKFIFAPHDISKNNVKRLASYFEDAILYSNIENANPNSNVLIIDNIGLLSSIYQYGTIAYIGGGFGAGIHNTLEPITFGLPVIFGPNYRKFDEARELVQNKGGFSISNYDEFYTIMISLKQDQSRSTASKKALDYILKNVGATDLIYSKIFKFSNK